MATELPTEKTLVNLIPDEVSFVDELPNTKKFLKENFTKLVLDERHKSLSINNLYEDMEEDEN